MYAHKIYSLTPRSYWIWNAYDVNHVSCCAHTLSFHPRRWVVSVIQQMKKSRGQLFSLAKVTHLASGITRYPDSLPRLFLLSQKFMVQTNRHT